MISTYSRIQCVSCKESLDVFPSDEEDLVCDCGNLIFLSDYELCEKTYEAVFVIYGSEAN